MKIVFTPDWFLGTDVLIEVASFLVLALFFWLSYRNYKLSKNKHTLHLGFGFLLIAVAEIATILTKLVLYYDTSFTQQIGHMVVTYHVVKSVDIFYYVGFFFYKLLTLLGLYVIYRIPQKKQIGRDVVLSICFILIAALFDLEIQFIFNLAVLVLLAIIISTYAEIYKKNKNGNTKILIWAFSILALSHILLIFSRTAALYVIGQTVQLVSYIILLVLIILILNYGRKKKK